LSFHSKLIWTLGWDGMLFQKKCLRVLERSMIFCIVVLKHLESRKYVFIYYLCLHATQGWEPTGIVYNVDDGDRPPVPLQSAAGPFPNDFPKLVYHICVVRGNENQSTFPVHQGNKLKTSRLSGVILLNCFIWLFLSLIGNCFAKGSHFFIFKIWKEIVFFIFVNNFPVLPASLTLFFSEVWKKYICHTKCGKIW